MKSVIVALKGVSLDYGQRAICRQSAIATEATESEAFDGSTCMIHVEHAASCYSVYCIYYGMY